MSRRRLRLKVSASERVHDKDAGPLRSFFHRKHVTQSVDDLTLHKGQGEDAGFHGPNGAEKTITSASLKIG